MHLRDGRRRHRTLVEFGKDRRRLRPQLLDEKSRDRRRVLWWRRILQRGELRDDGRRHDVGPGREELAELYEDAFRLLEGAAQPDRETPTSWCVQVRR